MKRLTVTFVVLAALAGCAPTPVASPTTSETPTPSPTPTPTSEIATALVMSATGVTVQDADGDVLEQVTYADDPLAAVATLTEAIGTDPQVFPPDPDDGCDTTSTDYIWGAEGASFTLTTTPGAAAPRGQFKVSGAASVGDLAVSTSTGLMVGGDAAAVIAGLPADEFEPELGSLIWERSATIESAQGSFAFGGVAQYDTQGIVTSISAPGTLLSGLC